MIKERFRITLAQTANERNDHAVMFIVDLPFAVFSFSEKLSSFILVSKARIIEHYSLLGLVIQAVINAIAILNLSNEIRGAKSTDDKS